MRQNASQSGTETAHANDTSNNFQPSAKNLKDSGDKAESESKPRAILLSGFMRSGSSFVGEVFNVHPQVFYMFEPLHPFYNTARVQNQSKMEFLSILEKKMIEPKQGCKKETNKRRIEHLGNALRNLYAE
ncbi:unnamed protein product [Oikopleura dioica]|uniref:Sulfotransferase n=1 Tax=Oikopleura dioica TaxID=34765 RepID=E4X013_OIKDI|nr:unnamed protein product [Oikopleura dioica]